MATESISRFRIDVRFAIFAEQRLPEVRFLVDGLDLIDSALAYRGRDPDQLIGPFSPLIPTDEPRDVVLTRCGCGEEACGSVVGRIRTEHDEVIWDNFRDGPGAEVDWPYDLDVPAIRFDKSQYMAELDRAHRERDWEPPIRTTARRVRELLTARGDELAERGFSLYGMWTGVAQDPRMRPWREPVEGISVLLEWVADDGTEGELVLGFPGQPTQPEEWANEIVRSIFAKPTGDWPVTFRNSRRSIPDD